MRKITLAIAFSALSAFSYCQKNYQQGYIVQNNGDTLLVQLQEERPAELLLKVKFKKTGAENELSAAAPGEIKGFGYLNGSIYQSARFSEDPLDSTEIRQYFVRQLLKGAYDLFVYPKTNRRVYLVRHNGEQFLLSGNTLTNNGEVETEGNFKNQLLFMSRDCSTLKNEVEFTDLNEQSIVRFVTRLNNCLNPGVPVITYNNKSKNDINLTAFAGALPIKGSLQINAEIMVRWNLSKKKNTFSLNAGMHYSNVPSGISSGLTPSDPLWKYRRRDGFYSFPVMLQYHVAVGKIGAYIGTGFSAVNWDHPFTFYQGVATTDPTKLVAIGEVGAEYQVSKFFLVKGAWRYEKVLQYPALGIAVKF